MLTVILCLSIGIMAVGVVGWLYARVRRRETPEVHLLWIPLGTFVYALAVWTWVTRIS